MTSTFERVLDQVGAAVVSGEVAEGSRRSVDDLVARTGAGRIIVREAVRVLVALGLLTARRRVGVTVLGLREWDVLDPRVLRWRLRGPDGDRVAVELRELRAAVEPAAAAAAARRAALDECADRREALRTTADGNALYGRLHQVVGQVLRERGSIRPDRRDVGLHLALADAVLDRRPDDAASTMRAIVDRT